MRPMRRLTVSCGRPNNAGNASSTNQPSTTSLSTVSTTSSIVPIAVVVFALFSALALFIAVVGLWILTLFAAHNRRKEMGVRKVFGATGWNLFSTLSSEFLWLVAAAVVIGLPLAWYAMQSWLGHYPFRIGISGWMFVVPVVILVAVTVATVSAQIMATLRANPIRSLKSE